MRLAAALSLVFLFLCHPGAQTRARAADHVVIISIDGFKPADYLESHAKTPTLQRLKERGSWAEGVIGQYPSLTYPSHTSIATGVRPARHGIAQNTKFDPPNGSTAWYFENSAMKVPAIWDVAKNAGLTTAAVSWPVTVGAKIDYLFPETNQAPRETSWLELARKQSTPGLIDAVVARLGGFDPDGNRNAAERDRFAAAAASHMIEQHKPNLLLIHFVETDIVQHADGPGTPSARAALERVDGRVGEVIASLEKAGIAERAAVLISGDHGFYRIHSALQPNAVLREMGVLTADAQGKITDWQAAAHRLAIRLRDPGDRALAARIEARFTELAHGQYRGLFRVVGREEIAALGGDPDVLLIIEPVEGYSGAAGVTGGFLVPYPRRGDHGFMPTERRMHTGLVVAGSGIARGIVMPLARQIDIAPTAARLLGFEMTHAEGAPMVGIISATVSH